MGRTTSYCWNNFALEMFEADVGCGQGSALSPVLSALAISLMMKLYYRRNPVQGSTLLSYVDDGTILVQSLSLQANVSSLRKAYVLVLDRKSTRLNSSHSGESRMPSSA